jgi:hypothetical protein
MDPHFFLLNSPFNLFVASSFLILKSAATDAAFHEEKSLIILSLDAKALGQANH